MDVTNRLSALAQLTRLDILARIAKQEGGLSAARIADSIGTARTNTSVHLTVLRNAGLVTAKKRGREITYSVVREAVIELADYLRGTVS